MTYVVYTDYQPRLEGSDRYKGANRPETRIMIYPFYDNSMRPIYRDRRYILNGFAYPAKFYSPDYSVQTPGQRIFSVGMAIFKNKELPVCT